MHRPPARCFEDLEIWQVAHQLALSVYRFSGDLPKREQYGLISQIRRAAVSVPANIAEGFRKRSVRETIRFYNIAQGSLEECRYYLILMKDLEYGNPQDLLVKVRSAQRLLGTYIKRLEN